MNGTMAGTTVKGLHLCTDLFVETLVGATIPDHLHTEVCRRGKLFLYIMRVQLYKSWMLADANY